MIKMRDKAEKKSRRRRRITARRRVWFVLMIALTFFGMIYGKTRLRRSVVIEAGGEPPTLSDFLLWDYRDVKMVSGLSGVDTHKIGKYPVTIAISGREYFSTLTVADTVRPRVTADSEATVFTTGKVKPADLLQSVEDATKVTVKYASEPDFKNVGETHVKLLVIDEGNNITKVTVPVKVVNDSTPPKISGVREITMHAGGSVSYKQGVTATDDYDKNPVLTVDTGGVDIYTVGDYTVKYTAEDAAGNKAEATAAVHVKPAGAEYATEDLVNRLADRVLSQIITPGMSQYEKARAILVWVKSNVYDTGSSPHDSEVKGAYRGLYEKKGDCYAFTMAARYLLTRVGIQNMVVYTTAATENWVSKHCWNIINIGEGWYHYDTFYGLDTFYVTDEFIKKRRFEYQYDASKYPDIR